MFNFKSVNLLSRPTVLSISVRNHFLGCFYSSSPSFCLHFTSSRRKFEKSQLLSHGVSMNLLPATMTVEEMRKPNSGAFSSTCTNRPQPHVFSIPLEECKGQ